MKTPTLCLLLVFLQCASAFSQQPKLKADYEATVYKKYYIGYYEAGTYRLIDSIEHQGTFEIPIKFPKNRFIKIANNGTYTPGGNFENTSPSMGITFFYTGGNVSYKTSWKHESGNLEMKEGGEATLAIKKISERLIDTQNKILSIEQLLSKTADDALLTSQLYDAYRRYANHFNALCKAEAKTFANIPLLKDYFLANQQIVPEKNYTISELNQWRAQHYLDFINLKNKDFANLPILKSIYKNYMIYNEPVGVNDQMEFARMEKKANDYIKANAHPDIVKVLGLDVYQSMYDKLRNQFRTELSIDENYAKKEVIFNKVNDCLPAYDEKSPYHNKFVEDVIYVLSQSKKDVAYTAFTETSLDICDYFGWNEFAKSIAAFVIKDQRIKNPLPKTKKLISALRLRKGVLAPDLKIVQHKGAVENHDHAINYITPKSDLYNATAIVFYQSGCGPCQELMNLLQQNYAFFEEKKVRIISLSADTKQDIYDLTASSFPWMDKYCDFDGKNGVNFKNYDIEGTPTVFLVNSKGEIIEKQSTFAELQKSIALLMKK